MLHFLSSFYQASLSLIQGVTPCKRIADGCANFEVVEYVYALTNCDTVEIVMKIPCQLKDDAQCFNHRCEQSNYRFGFNANCGDRSRLCN